MKFFFYLTGIFWLIIQSIAPVSAQSLTDTLRIKEVQIVGSKVYKKFNETRSEIDSAALAKSSTVRLSELLSQNTPIFIKEYGRGAMATASFRGTAPSHTKVSWNGLDLNSPMLGNGRLFLNTLSILPMRLVCCMDPPPFPNQPERWVEQLSSKTEPTGVIFCRVRHLAVLEAIKRWTNMFSLILETKRCNPKVPYFTTLRRTTFNS